MRNFEKLYIGGEWTPSSGKGVIEVRSASTEQVIGRIPEGTREDVDRAVKAARAAFEAWSHLPVEQRLSFLQKLEKQLTARQDALAETITGEVGMPIGLSKAIQ